jgi:signal transduction histidine kinase
MTISSELVPMRSSERVFDLLASLSYRTGKLDEYLQAVAEGICQLLGLDWSVVTLCRHESERILASSLDLGDAAADVYALHGTLAGTVVVSGCPLVVDDARATPEYGEPPEGYCAYLGVPLRTASGETIGTICSFQAHPRHFTPEDIRLAQIFAERAATAIDNYQLYQQQQEMLGALERLAEIGQLAASIVHEVRNPLTTVLMGLQSFQSMDLPERARRRLALALDEAERLQRLLNEILLFAKPHTLQRQDVELNDWLQSLLEELRTLPVTSDRQLQFYPTSSPLWVRVDLDKLKQVLVNLVANACEAIGPGEMVSCRVGSIPSQQAIDLRIENRGEPIPPDLLPTLTQPFRTTKPNGNGLGLAIVKRIVEAHGGRLTIESSAAIGGTCVQVRLPCCQT